MHSILTRSDVTELVSDINNLPAICVAQAHNSVEVHFRLLDLPELILLLEEASLQLLEDDGLFDLVLEDPVETSLHDVPDECSVQVKPCSEERTSL